MAWEIESPTTKPSGAETLGQRAKRVGISTAIKPVEVVEGLGNLLFQNAPQPAQYLKEQFGLTPEYLEPQGFGESFVQKLGQSAPFAALGGVPSLVSSGIGAGFGAAAQQLGAPESIQDLVQIGSEIGAGRIPSKVPGAEKLLRSIPGLSGAIKIESNLAKAAGSSVPLKTAATGITDALRDVGNLLSKETDPKVVKQVSHALETISNNIVGGKITPNDAMQLRKNLYAQGNRIDKAKAADYIQPLTKGINNFFAAYSAENPTFWNHLNKRDRLNEMKHMRSYIGDWVEGALTPLGKMAGGELGKLVGQIPAKVLGGATTFTLGRGEKLLRTLLGNPEGRKYYFDMVKSVGSNDPVAFGKNFGHLINMFPKEFPVSEAQFIPEEPKWIIE